MADIKSARSGSRGRTLTKGDIAHYHKIVVALAETIRLMNHIDEVIVQHGGWPGAFQAAKASDEAAESILKAAEPLREYGNGGTRRNQSIG